MSSVLFFFFFFCFFLSLSSFLSFFHFVSSISFPLLSENDSFGDAEFRMIFFHHVQVVTVYGTRKFFFFFCLKGTCYFFFFYTILILIFSTFSPVHIPHPFLSHTLSLTPHYRSANSFSQFRSRLFEIYFFFSPSPFSSSNSISSL